MIGMEIKSRERVAGSDLRGLRALAAAAPDEWRGGLCVYQGREIARLDEAAHIWAVSAHRLFT